MILTFDLDPNGGNRKSFRVKQQHEGMGHSATFLCDLLGVGKPNCTE